MDRGLKNVYRTHLVLAIWLFGCLAIWLFGYLTVCLLGCSFVRSFELREQEQKILNPFFTTGRLFHCLSHHKKSSHSSLRSLSGKIFFSSSSSSSLDRFIKSTWSFVATLTFNRCRKTNRYFYHENIWTLPTFQLAELVSDKAWSAKNNQFSLSSLVLCWKSALVLVLTSDLQS